MPFFFLYQSFHCPQFAHGGGFSRGSRVVAVGPGGGLYSGRRVVEGKPPTGAASMLFCTIEGSDVVPSLVLLRLPSPELFRVSASAVYLF